MYHVKRAGLGMALLGQQRTMYCRDSEYTILKIVPKYTQTIRIYTPVHTVFVKSKKHRID
jgi:hypothetical protein